MLKLTFADQTGRLTDEKLRAEAEKYAPLLAGMKEKMGLDPMSTGWMDVENGPGRTLCPVWNRLPGKSGKRRTPLW